MSFNFKIYPIGKQPYVVALPMVANILAKLATHR